MTREERGAIVSPGRAALLTLALLGAVAAPSPLAAQDAGVSGIPLGPANARGLNGSVNDPSGIGNAAKAPVLPEPNLNPVPVPQVPNPVLRGTSRAVVYPWVREEIARPERHAASKHHRPGKPSAHKRASPRERDRYLGDNVPTICRGC